MDKSFKLINIIQELLHEEEVINQNTNEGADVPLNYYYAVLNDSSYGGFNAIILDDYSNEIATIKKHHIEGKNSYHLNWNGQSRILMITNPKDIIEIKNLLVNNDIIKEIDNLIPQK